ncbi:MAG: hypothetical protein WCK39_01310 [Methanomassiliicoccales archaeon]
MTQESMSSSTSSKRSEVKGEGLAGVRSHDDVKVEELLSKHPGLMELLKEAEQEVLHLIPDAELKRSCDGDDHYQILVLSVRSRSRSFGQVFDLVERIADGFYRRGYSAGAPVLINAE